MRQTITAVRAGRYANGRSINRQSFIINRDPEPFGDGRSRIFAENASFIRYDGESVFTPVVVVADSIEYVNN